MFSRNPDANTALDAPRLAAMNVLVIGAGPAGLSAALWLAKLGLAVEIADAGAAPGGQLLSLNSTGEWALGHAGLAAQDLARRYAHDIARQPTVALRARREVTELALDDEPGLRARFADGDGALYRAVLVATGLRPRPVPEGQLEGDPARIVIGAGDARLAGALNGTRVGVLGGGDNAFEVAQMLAARGSTVEILHRSPPRAAPRFVRACAQSDHVTTRLIAANYRVRGRGDGAALTENGRTHEFDWLVALLGYLPNTEFLRASGIPFADAALDAAGYVRTDAELRTPVARLYAAGDVTGKPYAGLPMALGQGAVAAKSISIDLARMP
jgi:thioredoxin reductase